MNQKSITFDNIADQLTEIGTLTSPSELHGLLCGRLCGGKRYQEGEWIESAQEFLEADASLGNDQQKALAALYSHSIDQLEDEDLNFLPILPDDDNEMSLRIAALGQWCHGFLLGFGTSGLNKENALSPETSEALRDFAAFVQLDTDAEDNEDSERDFAEIVEYVRVAALSVFIENDGGKSKQSAESKSTPVVH